MTVWMVCSSTPLKKEISAFFVLIVHTGFEEGTAGFGAVVFSLSGSNVTGTIVSFCCGIRKAPPLVDTCILPGGAASLYALFDWGLTFLIRYAWERGHYG